MVLCFILCHLKLIYWVLNDWQNFLSDLDTAKTVSLWTWVCCHVYLFEIDCSYLKMSIIKLQLKTLYPFLRILCIQSQCTDYFQIILNIQKCTFERCLFLMPLEAVKCMEGKNRQHHKLQLCYHLAEFFHSVVPFFNLCNGCWSSSSSVVFDLISWMTKVAVFLDIMLSYVWIALFLTWFVGGVVVYVKCFGTISHTEE